MACLLDFSVRPFLISCIRQWEFSSILHLLLMCSLHHLSSQMMFPKVGRSCLIFYRKLLSIYSKNLLIRTWLSMLLLIKMDAVTAKVWLWFVANWKRIFSLVYKCRQFVSSHSLTTSEIPISVMIRSVSIEHSRCRWNLRHLKMMDFCSTLQMTWKHRYWSNFKHNTICSCNSYTICDKGLIT